MKSNQYYKFEFPDYALPSFCSGEKPYYGTIEQFEDLLKALKSNQKAKYETECLSFALSKAKGVSESSASSTTNDREICLVPVQMEERVEITVDRCEWVHENVWGFPYYMRANSVHLEQIVISIDDKVIRCFKPQFFGLEYKGDESVNWNKLRNNFWGFPEMVAFRKDDDCIFSRLFMFEEQYADKDTALKDLHCKEKVKFNAFCDDIFGDG